MLNAQANATIATKNPTFAEYWAAGLAVIPEKNGIPTFAWGKIYNEKWKPTEDDLFLWDLDSSVDFGLVCGEASGVIALDIDHATDAQIARIKSLLGDSPCAKFGTKGITLFYAYNNEPSCNWVKDGVVKAELLSSRRKVTIPPSKHRTKPNTHYKWIGSPLLGTPLPTLPVDYRRILDSVFSIVRPAIEREYVRAEYDFPPSYEEAVEALNYCDPNCSNDEWVQIGMAFRSEVGDAGFVDFDKWSSRGSSYDAKSIYTRWRSFNSRSIGYGTLVYYAKQGGFQVKRAPEKPPTQSISIDNWTAYKLENYAAQIQEARTLPEFYTNAPHHVKLICDWITSTARYPQPLITLGAVLSFLGFYMGRDFVYKGIKGNIYNINLARTGHGKEHIISCLRGLMRELTIEELIGGSGATSDTAIFAKLQKNDGLCCYLIDEFQGFMKVLSNKKSGNSREAGLVALLLKAYTSRVISSVDYADPSERETITIKNPFMNLISFCTPEPFFEAVGSAEAFNGLVGRLTIFEAPKILPERNRKHNPEADLNVPQEIVRILKDIKANRVKVELKDGGWAYAQTTQVQELPDAYELIERINDEIDDKRREYDQEDSQMSNVIARVFEIMKKYALIASKGKQISVADITWAKAVADYNIGIMLNAAQNIADSNFERKKNHVFEFITKRGGIITKTEFTNYCKVFENRRERDDIMHDLIDAGKIEVVRLEGGLKPKSAYKVVKQGE